MQRLSVISVAVVVTVALGAVTGIAGASSRQPEGSRPASTARFACYSAQFGVFRPQARVVVDQFSRVASLSVSAPEAVCAPAPGNSTSYLTCFHATTRTTFLTRTVRVADEFARAAITVRSSRLVTLCAPSARVDGGGSTKPAAGRDLYVCYPAKTARMLTDDVEIEDEFGKSDDALVGPSRLCSPAARKGARPFDSRRFLTCYADESETKGETVVVRSELGFVKASLGPRGSLCTAAKLSS